MTIISATGHRPNKLGGYGKPVRERLRGLARDHLVERKATKAISGMALGWDQAWALGAIDLGIPFIAAVPFEGQEKVWPEESRVLYRKILAHAAEVVVISEFYSNRAMQKRNEWMVDQGDEIAALWNRTFGGTANCIMYAEKRKKPITNLWWRWMGDDFDALLA